MEEIQSPLEPTPTPKPLKYKAKVIVSDIDNTVHKPCKDCPDYSKEDLLREKVLSLRGKGYNDNQIAAMLTVHKQFVESVK